MKTLYIKFDLKASRNKLRWHQNVKALEEGDYFCRPLFVMFKNVLVQSINGEYALIC